MSRLASDILWFATLLAVVIVFIGLVVWAAPLENSYDRIRFEISIDGADPIIGCGFQTRAGGWVYRDCETQARITGNEPVRAYQLPAPHQTDGSGGGS